MVDAQYTIRKLGAESSKLRKHGCAIYSMCNNWMMSNGTSIQSLIDNVLSRMLMTPIGTKNKTAIIDGGICYSIIPYLTRCKIFSSISHFMGEVKRVIVTPF